MRSTLLLSLLTLASTCPAWAVTVEEVAELLASDGVQFDGFGCAVALDGNTVVIGALGDDDNGESSGSAYVFTRTGGVWAPQAKLLPADGEELEGFGQNGVALDGDTAIIGAWRDDDNGYRSGSAYVFTRTGGVWAQQAKLLPADGAAEDLFGVSATLDGDTAIIGAFWDDDNGENSGSAYVFTRTGGVWTQQAKLLPADGTADDRFGHVVALDGDTAIISATWDDGDGDMPGSAYVFTRVGGLWIEQAKLVPADGPGWIGFGGSVALDGDTAIIGASLDDDNGQSSGSAFLFSRSGGVWTQQTKFLPADGAELDRFGDSVAVQGDTAIIGAGLDDDNGNNSGSAYLFTHTAGVWTERAKLLASDGTYGDHFGENIAFRGDTAIVGAAAHGHFPGAALMGSAYVFRITFVCGDGILDPGEECDLGEDNSNHPEAVCRTNCTLNPVTEEIPTITEWGAILMAVVFVAVGVWVFRTYLKP